MKISFASLSSVFFFFKAFNAAQGKEMGEKVTAAFGGNLVGKRVVVIDHPPTAGLIPLLETLGAAGAEVFLRDHHGDSDRDGATVTATRALLGDRAVITTRVQNPACSGLVEVGEFSGDIVIADADQDGLTAALKSAGVSYPGLDADAAVLDGPVSGKTAEKLSPLGFSLVRAWGALPEFTAPDYPKVFGAIAEAFAAAAAGSEEGQRKLNQLAEEYERKVGVAKTLAEKIVDLAPGIRFLDILGAPAHDKPTLTGLLDKGAKVTVLRQGGVITKLCQGADSQISLARTKAGEAAGIDLAKLVPAEWARGPENGCISNTPFLLHLSPAKWSDFQAILFAAVK